MQVIATDGDDPRLGPVRDAISADYEQRYGPGGATYVDRDDAANPGQFVEPRGGVVLLLDGDEVVAAGAFTSHDASTARLKRIWTDPRRRREGLSRRILRELEDVLRTRGCRSMVLTTGHRQPEAVALYLSTGWTPMAELAGASPDERAFSREL